MTLILDTSILVDLERGSKETKEKLSQIIAAHPGAPFISFITYVEFLIGTEKFPLSKKAKLKEFLFNFPVLHTTDQTAVLLSHLKHTYDKKGKKKSLTDLFIASQTIEHRLTLATKDRDFEDIEELRTILF